MLPGSGQMSTRRCAPAILGAHLETVLTQITNGWRYDFASRSALSSLSAFCDSKMGRGPGRGAAWTYFAFKQRVQ